MKYTLEQLESLMTKARILGKLTQLNTKCGHAMYLIKDISDGTNLLYIPDDVECITKSKNPSYCDIECKTLKVIGGRNLRDTNKMFFKCKAQSIDLSDFNTSQVTDMNSMFESCESQSIDLSSFDTSQVKKHEFHV